MTENQTTEDFTDDRENDVSPTEDEQGTQMVSTPADEQVSSSNLDEEFDDDRTSSKDTFDRAYVEKLRKQAGDYRVKAKELGEQLFHARVAATGRLADPSDLPYDENLLDDMPALEAAIEALLERKPHLAARTLHGDIGQGQTSTEDTNLADILRSALN